MDLIYIVVILTLVFILFRQNSKKAAPPVIDYENIKKTVFISWLKEAKTYGINTIDELIEKLGEHINQSSNLSPPTQPLSQLQPLPQNPATPDRVSITPEQKIQNYPSNISNITTQEDHAKIQLSNASVLLYVGAFLIIFAVFAFVAFNWESYSNITKSLIIILATVAFYSAAFAFNSFKNLKQVSYVFLIIASISFALMGIGLWNFGLSATLKIDFSLYWLIYSIFALILYLVTLLITQKKEFYYVVLLFLYSAFISLSFSVTTDDKFRVVLIAMLNLIFYLFTDQIKEFKENTKQISLVINHVLNVVIILTVLANINILSKLEFQIIASVALLIPLIYDVIYAYREKYSPIIYLIQFFVPIKLLLLVLIFKWDINIAAGIFAGYALINAFITEYILDKEIKLQDASKTITWITVIASSVYLLFGAVDKSLTNYFGIIYLIVFALSLTVPNLLKKKYDIFSLGLVYLVYAGFVAQLLIFPKTQIQDNLPVALGIAMIFCFTQFIIFSLKNKELALFFNIPLFVAGSWAVICGILSQQAGLIFLTFAILHVLSTANSYVSQKQIGRILGIILFISWFSALLYVFNENKILTFTNFSQAGIYYLIPALIYAGIFEVLKFLKKDFVPDIIGGFTFAVIVFTVSLFDINYLFPVTAILFVYSIFALFRHKERSITLFVFLLAHITVLSKVYSLNTEFIVLITAVILVTLVFNTISIMRHIFPKFASGNKLQILKDFNKFSLISTCVITIMQLAIILQIFPKDSSYDLLFTLLSLLLFVNLIISENTRIKLAAGIPLVAAVWHFGFINTLDLQIYVVPVTLYLLVLSVYYYYKSNALSSIIKWSGGNIDKAIFEQGQTLEIAAYVVQYSTLLFQSSTDTVSNTNVITGMILLILSIGTLMFGLARKAKPIVITSIIFIFAELAVRLYVVILNIPWWIYLGLFGMFMIAAAVYILNKNEKV